MRCWRCSSTSRRIAEPLIELRFFRSVPFSSATLVAVLAFGTFSGFLFLNALYLQEVRGLPAFATGLYTLPLALATVVCSPVSGWLVGRSGTRIPLFLAGGGIAASALLLSGLDAGTPLARVMAAYVVLRCGLRSRQRADHEHGRVGDAAGARGAWLRRSLRPVARSARRSASRSPVPSSRGRHDATSFTHAMHSFFGLAVAAGALIVVLGALSNSVWGQKTLRRTAALIEAGDGRRWRVRHEQSRRSSVERARGRGDGHAGTTGVGG